MDLFCRGMVTVASWLAPRQVRASWCAEHRRELWHWCLFLTETGQFTPQNQLAIARHVWRLFPQALWLRVDRDHFAGAARGLVGAPATLLVACAAACSLLLFLSGIPRATHHAFLPPVPDPDHMVAISLDGSTLTGKYSRTRSDTLFDLASVWNGARLAEGVSPYSWAPANLLLDNRDLPITSARVGAGFFTTLGVTPFLGRVFQPSDLEDCIGCVVLSYALWENEFRSDSSILGHPVDLNGSPHKVIGILPQSFRILSPSISVWTLMDPAILFSNFQRRVGAIARLRPGVTTAALQHELSDLTENAGYVHPASQLVVTTAAEQVHHRLLNLLGFFLLATGCAVVVAVVRAAWLRSLHPPDGLGARLRWAAFLATKSLLLIVLVFVAAWGVMQAIALRLTGWPYSLVGEYAIWLYLPLAIVALSWSLHDQRERCRECLRLLELPVAIGRTGSVLLNWSGVEMVCPAGHGLLYQSASSENSLDRDRWHKLDDSWQSLFRED